MLNHDSRDFETQATSKVNVMRMLSTLTLSLAWFTAYPSWADENPWSRPFYADPRSPAAQVAQAEPSNLPAGVLAVIPQARWFTPDHSVTAIRAAVDQYVDGAEAAAELPVMATYAIPFRDCGSFSEGGLPSAAAYSEWVSQLKAGIGSRHAVVIIEPDALTSADCLTPAQRAERYAMLSNAVNQLSSSTTMVYIDGGHSQWLSAAELASRLQAVGVQNARGFSLNVSNFYLTEDQQAYGEKVSVLLGGKHYVIDTSRNGKGPAPPLPLNWCNPTGRGLGQLPTRSSNAAHQDASLWIKNPGQSDGTCDRGDPYSGHWFQQRAAEMYVLRADW